jgi:LPS transport system D
MVTERLIGPMVLIGLLTATLCANPLAPIADRVDASLLSGGVLEKDISVDGKVAFVFADEDGTSALHIVGDAVVRFGDSDLDARALRANEAVIWVTERDYHGRPFRHLQVFLWRDAQIDELAGTYTAAPVLFVTLSTFGDVRLGADDVARDSSAKTEAYLQGNALRKAFAAADSQASNTDVWLRVFNPSGLGVSRKRDAPRPVIQFQAQGNLTLDTIDGRQVLVLSGGIYLSRGVPGVEDFFEIQSDSAVVFFAEGETLNDPLGGSNTGLGGKAPAQTEAEKKAERKKNDKASDQIMATSFGTVGVESVYLEGDVRMSQGVSFVRAARLYYNFLDDKAVILDAVARTQLPGQIVPLFLRAREIRQISKREFTANDAMLTTSEFRTPHYHIGAQRIELINRTQADPSGSVGGLRAGSFRIRHATLNLGGRPLLYWPYIQGNLDTSETSLRNFRLGFSQRFGAEFETKWDLFNVLGYETPSGFDATLSLDLYTNRGPAFGVDANYQRDKYYGEVKSYFMTDQGEDFLGRDRETQRVANTRGRFLLRHRQYLEDDWQLTLELSYISDRGFLEEFFEREFDNDKEQETLVYLKKQRENWAFTAHWQSRILDFTTQTERLPDFGFHLTGEPLGGLFTWYSENRLGLVRRSAADKTLRELLRGGEKIDSGVTGRADFRQEVGMPLDVGDWRFVPFVTLRSTVWDSSRVGGGRTRAFGMVGVRGSTYFQKTYADYKSTLWDINGVRHIIKPDFVAWVSEANRRASDLFPFDDTVEGISTADGVMFGVRQRWQTKRGEGSTARTVDFLTQDTEVGLFSDIDTNFRTNGFGSFSRPENSIAKNYVNSSTIWRVNDRTAVLSEMNYDLNDGRVDVLNISTVVERTPRLSYLLGYRFIDKSDSNLLWFDMNYRLTEKHTLAMRELFDLERGRTLDFTVAFIRRFPRWFGAVSFELDQAENDFGISFAMWPEGVPQAAVGSRRFTGLANTTGISNN